MCTVNVTREINGKTKSPACSLYAAECQRELVRDEILVLAWHRFWLKGHYKRGNKICMSSVFRNLLAMSKQTFSDSFSGKRHDNILCIRYQQRANVIMGLRLRNIILPSLKSTSRHVKATFVFTLFLWLGMNSFFSCNVLFWLCLFLFVDLWVDWKALWGEKGIKKKKKAQLSHSPRGL